MECIARICIRHGFEMHFDMLCRVLFILRQPFTSIRAHFQSLPCSFRASQCIHHSLILEMLCMMWMHRICMTCTFYMILACILLAVSCAHPVHGCIFLLLSNGRASHNLKAITSILQHWDARNGAAEVQQVIHKSSRCISSDCHHCIQLLAFPVHREELYAFQQAKSPRIR